MKKIERFRQWTGGRFGSISGSANAEDDQDADIELRKQGLERLEDATTIYLGNIQKQKKVGSVDSHQKLHPLEALSKAAQLYSDEFSPAPAGAYPRALSIFAQTHAEIATETEKYGNDLSSTFLFGLRQDLDTISQYSSRKKTLESKKGALDAVTNKLQKSKSENYKLEDEHRQAQVAFDDALDQVREAVNAIEESEPQQYESLTQFVDIEIAYVSRYLELLQNLKSQWPTQTFKSPTNNNRDYATTISNNSRRNRSGSATSSSRRPGSSASPIVSQRPSRTTSPIPDQSNSSDDESNSYYRHHHSSRPASERPQHQQQQKTRSRGNSTSAVSGATGTGTNYTSSSLSSSIRDTTHRRRSNTLSSLRSGSSSIIGGNGNVVSASAPGSGPSTPNANSSNKSDPMASAIASSAATTTSAVTSSISTGSAAVTSAVSNAGGKVRSRASSLTIPNLPRISSFKRSGGAQGGGNGKSTYDQLLGPGENSSSSLGAPEVVLERASEESNRSDIESGLRLDDATNNNIKNYINNKSNNNNNNNNAMGFRPVSMRQSLSDDDDIFAFRPQMEIAEQKQAWQQNATPIQSHDHDLTAPFMEKSRSSPISPSKNRRPPPPPPPARKRNTTSEQSSPFNDPS